MTPAGLRRLLPWFPFGWVRHIPRAGEPYMDRYSVRAQKASGSNPWRVYLNHFLAPDEPGHHDHPSRWSFSIVLWGSYTEEILERHPDRLGMRGKPTAGVKTCRVRWFNWIPAGRYHRISALHPGPGAIGTWTLFFAGPLRRDPVTRAARPWGWWVPGRGHVPWQTYRAEQTAITPSK